MATGPNNLRPVNRSRLTGRCRSLQTGRKSRKHTHSPHIGPSTRWTKPRHHQFEHKPQTGEPACRLPNFGTVGSGTLAERQGDGTAVYGHRCLCNDTHNERHVTLFSAVPLALATVCPATCVATMVVAILGGPQTTTATAHLAGALPRRLGEQPATAVPLLLSNT